MLSDSNLKLYLTFLKDDYKITKILCREVFFALFYCILFQKHIFSALRLQITAKLTFVIDLTITVDIGFPNHFIDLLVC